MMLKFNFFQMKQFFRIIFLFILLLGFYVSVSAVPAYPYPIKISQPDGTEITILLRGDEFFSYKTTIDGYLLTEDKDGVHRYAKVDATGRPLSTGVKARELNQRTNDEIRLIEGIDKAAVLMKVNSAQKAARTAAVSASSNADNGFPLTGTPRSLVILVNFADKNFVIDDEKQAFTDLLNEEGYADNGGTGSARDYFRDASNGVFAPQFDVVGPYTLPQNMEYYGGNISDNDKNPRQMVLDACQLADEAGLDFIQYDSDNNGVIDNVFIYYAGYNEAEGGGDNTVWPHRWSMPSSSNYRFDGVQVWDYACTSELRGRTGANMCGIGTFAHEFGHVLGLPDYYATNGADHFTLDRWHIMDGGAYNNQGRTPPTYSAYDRFFLDWLKPIELKVAQNVTLNPLLDSNEAFVITKEGNHNMVGNNPQPREFFILENRQKSGWDAYLPGHGMLITKVYYNPATWYSNGPNNDPNAMGMDIMEADGYPNSNTMSGDPFPGTYSKTAYNPVLRSGVNIDKPLTFINESETGVITFRFMGGGNVPVIKTEMSLDIFNTVQGTPSDIQTLKVYGSNLNDSVKMSFSQKVHFEMRVKDSIDWKKQIALAVEDSLLDTTLIEIRYNPAEPSFKYSHNEAIDLSSENAENMKLLISGISTRPVYVVPPLANEAIEVHENSFVANWNNVFDASGFYLTVYTENDTIANAKWIKADKKLTVVADTIRLLVPAKTYYYKVKASDKTLYADKTINYENITYFSNTVEVKTKADTNLQKLKTVIMGDATVTVIMPEKNQMLYIYNTAGMLIKQVVVPDNVINITGLPRGKVYILKSGTRRGKLIL